jgi:hypothetical protein
VLKRRFSAWQKTVALAPLLMLMAYLPGEAMLRCRIDGLLRSACCCPETKDVPTSQTTLKAADCCDREVAASERPAMDGPRAPEVRQISIATAAVGAAAAWPAIEPSVRVDRAAQRHGPAREGPPLVLLKHAFLI